MRCRIVAVPVSFALVVMASLPLVVGAQEASPAAELGPPSAAECQVAPRAEGEIAALSGTPSAVGEEGDATAPMELPEGGPVDEVTRGEIELTLREAIACAKAGDLPRLLALYSDEAVRRFVLAEEPVPIVPGQPGRETVTRPATPTAGADITPVVREARLLPDGRVAALVTSVAPGSRADVVLFVKAGERWLIDEVHPLAVPESTPVAGSDNPAVQAVLADAAGRFGIPASEVQIVSVEPREWADTSLGCPKEGEFYAQVITPGYRIVVSGAGQQMEYHTDTEGHFVVCET
jgi:hypothetical protein